MKLCKAIPLASLISLTLLTACSNTSSSSSIERSTVNGLPTVVAKESAEASAKVQAVDYGNRSIALEGPDGNTEIFKVAPSVRNFPQIKKGDTVHMEYASRLQASVRKTTDTPSTTVVDGVQLAELGKKPGILCTRNAQIEATVASIDYQTRKLELKTAMGSTISLTADKDLKNLENVHKGDQVVFDYAEAISIHVD